MDHAFAEHLLGRSEERGLLVIANAQPRGFTLIELMVALAIVAILMLIGMPSFTTFLRNSEIRSTAESLINGLRAASTEATRQNTRIAFTLAGATNAGWTINPINDPIADTNCTDLGPAIQQYASKEAGRSSKVTITPAGTLAVCFTGIGRVWNQGVAPINHIQQIDITSVVAGDARPLRIIIDDPRPGAKSGLRMCDPDPALAALIPPDPRAC